MTRRQWEHCLKSEFAFFQYLSQLFLTTYFVKCRRTLLELKSLGPYPSTEREIKFGRCMFTSSIKREAFSRRSCAKTGKEMYVQSCCFAYKIYCFVLFVLFFFWRSRCRPRRWILKSLMTLLSTTTVLFRTTFTRTIKLNPLLKLFLGSNLSQTQKKNTLVNIARITWITK